MMKKEKVTSVSIEPCVSNKSKLKPGDVDITLTAKELALMLRLTGADFASLPESPFDKDGNGVPAADLRGTGIKFMAAYGLGNVRKIMDSIMRGECDADIIEIKSCPSTDGRACCESIGSTIHEAIQII